MAGALLSSTGYALAPYIDSMRIPMVYPVVSADDLSRVNVAFFVLNGLVSLVLGGCTVADAFL